MHVVPTCSRCNKPLSSQEIDRVMAQHTGLRLVDERWVCDRCQPPQGLIAKVAASLRRLVSKET